MGSGAVCLVRASPCAHSAYNQDGTDDRREVSPMKLVLVLSFLFAAQGKAPEKCMLACTVVNSLTGEPLNKVQILAEPTNSSNSTCG
jgi:hypothetical protein